jgi:hypothetical protein
MAVVVLVVDRAMEGDLQALLVASALGAIVYGSLVLRWWRGRAAFDDLVVLVRGRSPSGR